MDDNLAPHLSPKAIRIMMLFKEHGHDMEKLLAAHPEITPEDLAQVAMEVMGAIGVTTDNPKPVKRTRRRKRGTSGAYQIKITLRGSKPPIWRRVIVPGELTLNRLHEVVQTAMGWYDSHLHLFEIDGQSYSGTSPEGYEPEHDELDESEYRLCDVIDGEKAKFRYCYDFGDGWEHSLIVEKIIARSEGPKLICLSGKGRCPPEDCGGIWGYYHLLNVLANPNDEEHENMKEWVGGSFDPAEFNADDVTEALARIRI